MPTLTTSVNPLGSGTIVETGSGDNHIITANANGGYNFQNWLLKGYTQLEYIESSGTQYIDSGFKCNQDTTIETKYQFVNLNNGNTIGTVDSGSTGSNSFGMNLWSSTYFFCYGNNGTGYTSAGADTNEHIYKQDKNLCYIDNVLKVTCPVSTFTNAYNLFVLGWGRNGSCVHSAYAKMWYFKIWDNGTLVRDFIPVVRHSDGQIGMLDLVHFKFYGNNGTGVFIGGDFI